MREKAPAYRRATQTGSGTSLEQDQLSDLKVGINPAFGKSLGAGGLWWGWRGVTTLQGRVACGTEQLHRHLGQAELGLLYWSKFILEKTIFTGFPQQTLSARPRLHHRLRTVRHPKPSHFHEAESSRTETSWALLPPSKCSQHGEGSQETLRDILRSCGYGCSPAAHCITAACPSAPVPGSSCSTASPTALQAPLLLSLGITGVQGPVLSKKSNPNSKHPSV